MRSGIRRKTGVLAAAGLLDCALQFGVSVILVRHLTTQEFGDYRLVWLIVETGLILFPFSCRSLYSISCRAPLPEPAPQERRDLRTCCPPAFAILLLLGLTPRESIAALSFMRQFRHEYIHKP